jgi:hypothetical protein
MTKIRNVFLIFLIIIITNNLSYSSILSNQDDEYNNALKKFNSTAEAMSIYYAINKNQSVNTLLTNNPETLSLIDSNFSNSNIKNLLSNKNTSISEEDYKNILLENNIGFTLENSNLRNLQNDFSDKQNSIDKYVISSGLEWSKALNSLSFGNLNSINKPEMPKIDNYGVDNLSFGLFLNQTIASFIGNYPDIFSIVEQTGVVSQNANKAWNTAINNVSKNSGIVIKNITGADDCSSSFVDGLTNNNFNSCSPCFLSGSYSNKVLANSLSDPDNPIKNLDNIKEFDFSEQNEFDFSNKSNCELNKNNINNTIISTIKKSVKALK